MFARAPTPKSYLGRYRLLAPTAGVKVSPLCLGAMNFGDAWYVEYLLTDTYQWISQMSIM